jgi:hypothetical protein
VLSTSSVELGTRHQTPTLIGCIFLILKPCQNFFVFSSPRLGNSCNLQQPPPPSEALYSIPVFNPLRTQNQTFFANLLLQPSAAAPKRHHKHLQKPATFAAQASVSEALDYSTCRLACKNQAALKHATFPGASQDSDCHNLRRAGGSRDCSEGTRRSSLARMSTAPWSRSPHCAALYMGA